MFISFNYLLLLTVSFEWTHCQTAVDLCLDSKINSVLEFPNRTWLFFRDQHYYEIGPFGKTLNSPLEIKSVFKEVETPIDAALDWSDNILFFFKGDKYWKYQNNTFISSRKISDGFAGIPDGPFDDIFRWNVNQKTYFFKEGKFWRYDSKIKKVAEGYPKKISEYWKGIPDSFNAAISSRHRNQTYFFKDDKYYRFDDISKNVVHSTPPYPRDTKIWFFKCRLSPEREKVMWSTIPIPPPIPDRMQLTTDQNYLLTTLHLEVEEKEKEEGEGWLIFLTIILGLLMIAVLGTGSYAAYLTFFVGSVPLNIEENQIELGRTNASQPNRATTVSEQTPGMPSTSHQTSAPTSTV